MTPPTPELYAQHHAENHARFQAIEGKLDESERKLDANTAVTERLAGDTAELVEMWKDAGVFFKWMRRAGRFVVGFSKALLAIGAIYAVWKQWWSPK
jgi:hypothetical protein